jgi:hypothetical protein
MEPGVSGGSPSRMRPYGFSRTGATRTPRFTFDTKARTHLELILGYHISPVITIRNIQTYLDDLNVKMADLWDQSGGRLSAKQQQHVTIIKRTQAWLVKVAEGLPE